VNGGVERKIHFFAMGLPHSDAVSVVAYPAETTEAFCGGHVRAFSFFGGVPMSNLDDNTMIAVARILGDGKRQRARVFSELQSHYLFIDRFGRTGKGNDKGKVEGLVGYARRYFLDQGGALPDCQKPRQPRLPRPAVVEQDAGPGTGHDAVLGDDADVGCVYAGLPLQLGQDGLSQLRVV